MAFILECCSYAAYEGQLSTTIRTRDHYDRCESPGLKVVYPNAQWWDVFTRLPQAEETLKKMGSRFPTCDV